MKRFGALVGALGIVIALAGCAGGTPSASPSEGPSTSTSTIASIVIGGDAVRFVDSTGAGHEIGYTAPVAEALAAAENALGAQTGTKEYPATNHTVPSTSHDFGGFSVIEEHYDGAVDNDVLVNSVWTVRTSVASVGSVTIATSTGVAVGSSIDDIPGHSDPNRLDVVTVGGKSSAYILVEASSGSILVPDGSDTAVGVLATASTWPGPITQLGAPVQFGGA